MQSEREKKKLKEELKEAGLSKPAADAVVEKLEAGDEAGAMALLDAHREKLIERFHQSRECIDCVDYLVYQLQKSKNG